MLEIFQVKLIRILLIEFKNGKSQSFGTKGGDKCENKPQEKNKSVTNNGQ